MIETHASDSPTVPLTAMLRGFQRHVRTEIESADGQRPLLELFLRFVEALLAYIVAHPLHKAATTTAPEPSSNENEYDAADPWTPERIAQAAAHLARRAIRARIAASRPSRAERRPFAAPQSSLKNHPLIATRRRTARRRQKMPEPVPWRRKNHSNPPKFARPYRYDITMK